MAPPFSLDWSSQLQFGGPLMAANQQRTPFNLNFGLGQMQNPMAAVPSMYDMGSWGQQPMQLQAPGQLQMDPRWFAQSSAAAPAVTPAAPTQQPFVSPMGTLSAAERTDMMMSDPNWNGVLSSDPSQTTTPQAGTPAQGFQFGWNLPTAAVMTQGIGALGNLALGTWGLIQGQNQFDDQMAMMNKNYANALKSYNDALDQRIKGRNPGGHTQAQQDEFNRRKLTGK